MDGKRSYRLIELRQTTQDGSKMCIDMFSIPSFFFFFFRQSSSWQQPSRRGCCVPPIKKRGEEARGFTTVRGAPQNGDGRVEADFAIMRLTAQPRHKICIFFKGGAKNCSKTREMQIPGDLLAIDAFPYYCPGTRWGNAFVATWLLRPRPRSTSIVLCASSTVTMSRVLARFSVWSSIFDFFWCWEDQDALSRPLFCFSLNNGVYSLKWRLTERYPRWGTLADARPGRAAADHCKSSEFLQELRISGFPRFGVSPTCFPAK